MDANKSHFMNLLLASLAIAFLLIAATVTTVSWSPILPEAIIVDINRSKVETYDEFSSYVALHQTESWHYTGALHYPLQIVDCLK